MVRVNSRKSLSKVAVPADVAEHLARVRGEVQHFGAPLAAVPDAELFTVETAPPPAPALSKKAKREAWKNKELPWDRAVDKNKGGVGTLAHKPRAAKEDGKVDRIVKSIAKTTSKAAGAPMELGKKKKRVHMVVSDDKHYDVWTAKEVERPADIMEEKNKGAGLKKWNSVKKVKMVT
jgi:hypothetical protein